MSTTSKLTAKQSRFIDEYMKDLNATQAASRAGYSKSSSQVISCELLVNPIISAELHRRMAIRAARVEVTQDYVLKTIIETIEHCKQNHPIYTPDGKFVGVEQASPSAVLKGAELLGKHLGMFVTKVDVNVKAEVTHTHDLSSLTVEELRQYRELKNKMKLIGQGNVIDG